VAFFAPSISLRWLGDGKQKCSSSVVRRSCSLSAPLPSQSSGAWKQGHCSAIRRVSMPHQSLWPCHVTIRFSSLRQPGSNSCVLVSGPSTKRVEIPVPVLAGGMLGVMGTTVMMAGPIMSLGGGNHTGRLSRLGTLWGRVSIMPPRRFSSRKL
jgi:hypothetical protein